jgi:Ca2+-binding EF-hand superfamily protein
MLAVEGENSMKRIVTIALAACLATQVSAQAEIGDSQLAAVDTNGDGMVTRDEFDAFAARAFQTLDTNSDRSLSATELSAGSLSDSMSDLDADGNGDVSREEIGRQMIADFSAADQDGNGVIY